MYKLINFIELSFSKLQEKQLLNKIGTVIQSEGRTFKVTITPRYWKPWFVGKEKVGMIIRIMEK